MTSTAAQKAWRAASCESSLSNWCALRRAASRFARRWTSVASSPAARPRQRRAGAARGSAAASGPARGRTRCAACTGGLSLTPSRRRARRVQPRVAVDGQRLVGVGRDVDVPRGAPEHGEEALDAHFVAFHASTLGAARLLRVKRPARLGFDFRPFPAARRAEKAAAVRRSLNASLRPSPTNYEPRARALHVAAQKAHFAC